MLFALGETESILPEELHQAQKMMSLGGMKHVLGTLSPMVMDHAGPWIV
jgi:hypothetical protein